MTRAPTYAAVPGTGPAGERCRTCNHARGLTPDPKAPRRAPRPWCAMAVDLARAKTGGQIALDTPACRYWQTPTGLPQC